MKTVLMACVALTGCATVTRGTTEVLVIETEPAGASVELQPGDVKCTTPCALKLKRKGTYTVAIQRDGYEPASAQVLPQTANAGGAGMAGNILLGGIIGAVVDGSSGAMKDLKPNPLKVTLVKVVEVAEVAAK